MSNRKSVNNSKKLNTLKKLGNLRFFLNFLQDYLCNANKCEIWQLFIFIEKKKLTSFSQMCKTIQNLVLFAIDF